MSSIPVLCYHYFGADRRVQAGIKEEDCAYIIPIDEFERTLVCLRDQGYTFGLLDQGTVVTLKSCVITIDDAHRSVLDFAFPVLSKLNIPAALFVVPGWVGQEGYLQWSEIRKLAESGWQIGSHGLTHRFLPSLSDKEISHELSESATVIRQNLAVTLRDSHSSIPLAVPIGGITARIERLARQAGYTSISCSRYGFWDGRSDKSIPRIVLKEPHDSADAIDKLLHRWSLTGLELSLRSLAKQGRNVVAECTR